MDDVQVVTFGCRLNAYESELVRQQASSAGLTNAVIVNTCAVTAEAERQARQAIRRARRRRPDARIIVTGCAAQISPSRYAEMDEVDTVLGNAEKLQSAHFGTDRSEPIRVNDASALVETASHLVSGFEGRARAFVQVQNGCDHRCTFCIIPLGRGPSRSVPIGAIVEQVDGLVAEGFAEVVLTGVDITAYGTDLPGQPTLGQMVRRLLRAVPALPRLRLSSIDAAEVDRDLLELIAGEPRLMPHLHLSLQSGDDLILKRMKRRHSRAGTIAFARQLRDLRPDIVLGADLIAGFPTETEAMFANSLALIEECGLALLHVFPFSARPQTPAARMPQLPGPVRRERAVRLRDAGARILTQVLRSHVGKTRHILVETPFSGRTEHYLPVRFEAPQSPTSLIPAHIAVAGSEHLIAAPLVPASSA